MHKIVRRVLDLARGNPRRSRHVAWSAAALMVVASCSDFARSVAPGQASTSQAARVALTTVVSRSLGSSADVVTLEVVASYVRRDASVVRLGTRSIPLTAATLQAVPISVDLAACLLDPDRNANVSERSCPVVLNLALLVNGTVVDRQVVGPVTLSPGVTSNVSEPVALFEITAVEVAIGNGPVLSPAEQVTTELGSALTLTARIRDRSGQLVPERTVMWSTDAPTVATVDARGVVSTVSVGSARLTASFGSVTRTVSLRVLRAPVALTITTGSSSGRGTVRSTPAGIDCQVSTASVSGACTFRFPSDSSVTLTSQAAPGSVFLLWGDACTGTAVDAPCRISMTQARSVSPRFAALRRLTVQGGGGDGRGRVTGPEGLDCAIAGTVTSGVCAVSVPQGATVNLAAAPGDGARSESLGTFQGWGNDCAATATPSCTLTVGAIDPAVSVSFLDARSLNVTVEGTGIGRVTSESGLSCVRSNEATSGTCAETAKHGTTVALTATAGDQSQFSGWNGDCAQTSGSSCTVVLTSRRSVTARFTALRRLSVGAGGGDGRGRVTGPLGLDCRFNGSVPSGVCAVVLAEGAGATLTATADNGSGPRQTFAGWGGDCASAVGATCSLGLSARGLDVTVRFFDEQRATVTLAGTGAGRVTSNVGGISCVRAQGANTGVCDLSEPFGTSVTATAVPDARSTFAGWSGACELIEGDRCTTTLTAGRALTAVFTRKRVPLTLMAVGGGGGALSVNGQPACALGFGGGQATCVLQVDIGSSIVIGGLAGPGSVYAGLTGDCTAAVSCTLVASAPVTVLGRFDVQQVVLTVQLSGAGGGTVSVDGTPVCTLAPGQLAVTCTRSVAFGATLQVSGTAAAGSLMSGLSGGCVGLGACTLRVAGNTLVAARFDLAAGLTVILSGLGGGTVTTQGAITCTLVSGTTSGTCTDLVGVGSTVVLTARPDANSTVASWGGPCTGQAGNTCTIVVPERRTVTLRFDPVP